MEACGICCQPGQAPVPFSGSGATGLMGHIHVQAGSTAEQMCPRPPPPCFPSLLSLRPKQACILDTEVGPQHTDWFKEANSPNNSWLRLPEFRPRIIAGGWRAPSVPLRCTAALADLGRGVWRGRSHAPVCSRAFLFLIIGG